MHRLIFILLAGCLMLSLNSNGQSDCNKIEKTYAGNRAIKYKLFSKAEIRFDRTKPVFLKIFLEGSQEKSNQRYKIEHYDLDFEGDKYLFGKKYENLEFLSHLETQADSLINLRKCNDQYSLGATLYKDSIIYKISQCCSSNKQNVTFVKPNLPTARYNGNIKDFARMLEEKYKSIEHTIPGDSAYIFRGFVNDRTLNNLENITLLEGAKSPFSDFIKESLFKSGKSWFPMLQGGREVKSYVRIFARLNSDKSITLDVAK